MVAHFFNVFTFTVMSEAYTTTVKSLWHQFYFIGIARATSHMPYIAYEKMFFKIHTWHFVIAMLVLHLFAPGLDSGLDPRLDPRLDSRLDARLDPRLEPRLDS